MPTQPGACKLYELRSLMIRGLSLRDFQTCGAVDNPDCWPGSTAVSMPPAPRKPSSSLWNQAPTGIQSPLSLFSPYLASISVCSNYIPECVFDGRLSLLQECQPQEGRQGSISVLLTGPGISRQSGKTC